MSMNTPARFLRGMRQSPHVITFLLQGITDEDAQAITDGPTGWSLTSILCHLRDYDEIFYERARLIVELESPTLIAYDHEALATQRDYAHQKLSEVLPAFLAHRQQVIAWFEDRITDQWGRTGIHPENGEINLLEQAMQFSSHDLDHTEQITKAFHYAGR
jgi:uncharacterized damage-inducible protein DinB